MTISNRLKEPCPLFDTKPENVPERLIGAIQTAEEFKELKMLGLLPPLDKVTAFEFECYRTAEYASSTIEAEAIDEMNKKANSGTNKDKIGMAPPPIPQRHSDPDSPFGNWEE